MTIRLRRILEAPIKGFDQHSVQWESTIARFGAIGSDRRYKCTLGSTDEILNGKWAIRNNFQRFFRIRARYNTPRTRVHLSLDSDPSDPFTIPEQSIPLQNTEALSQWVSMVIEREVNIHQDDEVGWPDDRDLRSFTMISEASLEKIGSWFTLSTEEVIARLRPTLVFDGLEAFEEYRLLGKLFTLGEATFLAAQACLRCSVPSANPWTGERLRGFQKTLGSNMREALRKWADSEHWREPHGYYAAVNTLATSVPNNTALAIGTELIPLDRPVPKILKEPPSSLS